VRRTTLESYSYLGLDTVMKRADPQPTNGEDLTYIGSGTGHGGDQYTDTPVIGVSSFFLASHPRSH
jgi:hypothetical protein